MLIVVGLDACEITYLEKFCNEGALPFFSKIINNNSFLNLKSPSEIISSGSTWVSLLTGVNPSYHGFVFAHRQLRNGTYNFDRFYAGETQVPFLWEYLDQKKVAAIDIPYSTTNKVVNGIGITSWGTESKAFETSSKPENLIKSLIDSYGNHPLLEWYHEKPKNDEMMDLLLEKAHEGLDKRIKIMNDLINRDRWDLFFCSINEFHWLGHFIFDFISDKYENTFEQREKYTQKFKELFIKIDHLLTNLSEQFPEAGLIFFSNTGTRENLSGRHLLQPLLQRMGLYPETKKSWSPAAKYGSLSAAKIEEVIGAQNIAFVKKFIPMRIWNKMSRRIINTGSKWGESMAFEIPGDYSGLIRINLKGREPQGKVEPKDYDAVCDQITKALLELRHSKSGSPVVKEVIKIRDRYQGELIDYLPDLSVVWASDEHVTDVISPDYGRFTGSLPDKRSGAHRSEAFIGFHNVKGELKEGLFKTEAIAPTILTLLGVPVPERMEEKTLIIPN